MRTIVVAVAILSACFMQEVSGAHLRADPKEDKRDDEEKLAMKEEKADDQADNNDEKATTEKEETEEKAPNEEGQNENVGNGEAGDDDHEEPEIPEEESDKEEEEEEAKDGKPKEKPLPEFVPPPGICETTKIDKRWYLEVVKDKKSAGAQALGKRPFYIFGRSDKKKKNVHIPVAHPSLSRQHAVFIHMEKGPALFDLGSSNGTFINGKRIKSKIVFPMKAGWYFSLGKSTRRYYVRYSKGRKKPPAKPVQPMPPAAPPPPQATAAKAAGQEEKITVKKLSEEQIKKIKAKQARANAPNQPNLLGARKVMSQKFRSLVEMPRTAPPTVTLEAMASTPAPGQEEPAAAAIKSPKAAPDRDVGDDPDALEEGGTSWLIKPEAQKRKRDEDSD